MLQAKYPRELTKNKLFLGVDEAVITTLFDPKELHVKREGEIIYKTGDDSADIFVLLSGEVRVKYPSNNYVSKKQKNDFFGEKELIENTRRISSAVAFSKIQYYRINRTLFKKLMSKNSTFNSNALNLGEINLPEVIKEVSHKFSIVEKAKPISFKASKDMANAWKKDNEKIEDTNVVPSQLLENQTKEPAQNDIEDYLTPEDLSEKLHEEISIKSEEFKDWKINSDDVEKTDEVVETNENIEEIKEAKSEEKVEEVKAKEHSQPSEDNGINREMVRKIFASIEIIYNSITISDLIEKTVKALKDLTLSEAGNVILVNEQLSVLKLVSIIDEKYNEDEFQLPEGLTGLSALQKKILNFERPTEDSRYNSRIDLPGASRLKRILYFPVISEVGETVAVIQLARENKKYTDTDIAHINMLSKQIVSAIERAYRLENYLAEERMKSNDKLKEILLNEIKDPVSIINNYTEILSEKKLTEEVDEVIRMLQKQANSIEDLTNTLLSTSFEDYKLEKRGIHFNEFIVDVLELLSEFCQARDVTLFKKTGDGAIVDIDRGKFYSALYQIIRFCCEDAHKDRKIYLSTELTDDSIVTSIQGEGKGLLQTIEGNFKDIILGKDSTPHPTAGLMLAREIIANHKGQLEFSSIKGKGTTFKIILPVSNSSLN
ncbi:MAG: cyclic nucleotide-binding domain-containing protein [Ignavibacteria bacterium]|nr:cyclic nucleotide-binding domain-containing protein [Ignavibacteria bacterium]